MDGPGRAGRDTPVEMRTVVSGSMTRTWAAAGRRRPEQPSRTEAEFAKSDVACRSVPTSSIVLWDPDEDTLPHGTVYCAEQL